MMNTHKINTPDSIFLERSNLSKRMKKKNTKLSFVKILSAPARATTVKSVALHMEKKNLYRNQWLTKIIKLSNVKLILKR